MKKIAKIAIGAAAAGVAATFGTGAFIYESILNMKLSKKMIKVLKVADDRTASIYSGHEVFTNSYKWYMRACPEKIAYCDRNGRKIYGEVLRNPGGDDKWAICLHGFHGAPMSEAPYAKFLFEKGYSIVFPHIRAHGLDTHKYCSMGYHEKDMLLAWSDFIVEENPNAKILLHGVSMGAAAVMLAAGSGELPENVVGAIEDCGFTNCFDEFMYDVGLSIPFITKPVVMAMDYSSRLTKNFNFKKNSPIDAIKNAKIPMLFIHGTIDDLIPIRMCKELYEAYPAEKEKLFVEGALHAVSIAIDNRAYLEAMDNFISKYVK